MAQSFSRHTHTAGDGDGDEVGALLHLILPGQEGRNCETFTLFQLIAVGLAIFFVAGLLSAMGFSYCYHVNRTSSDSAVIHPSTPNHLNYNKPGNAAPKNEKYIPMEFKTLNKNNLHVNDDTCHHFSTSLGPSNVFSTTYFPPGLSKYDYHHQDAACRTFHMHS
uniref:Uncharacterized protein n=1 Tax=Knipowitschia caucasica TaxID=637954 RepID=A0AAV2L8N9_KNICA